MFFVLLPSFINYYFDRKKFMQDHDVSRYYDKMRAHAKKMVDSFIKLGPAFIKLGQLLSVRADVLPQPYMDEFYRLQDQVPQSPFDQIEKELNEEYGDYRKVFDTFEQKAVNAASLGEVHEAVYKGRPVVVKILRPNVKKIIDEDVETIRKLLPFASLIFGSVFKTTLETVLEQFYETVQDEMDYKKEAENMKLLKKYLENYDYIMVPELIEEVSTKRVIVMERLNGIKITDVEKIDKAGFDRRALAYRISRVYLGMVLRMEIFHADPHPGNLSVSSDGRIIIYDYGMVGSMSKELRDRMIWLYMSLAERNPSEIREALIEIGALDPFVNSYVIEKGIEMALNEMQGFKVSEADVRMLMYVANRVIYRFPFRLPKDLVLYLRMGLLLDSVCRTLDPDFNFLNILPNLMREEGLFREYYIFRAKRLYERISKYIDVSLRLPPLMQEYYQIQIGKEREKSGSREIAAGFVLGVIVAALVFFLFHL